MMTIEKQRVKSVLTETISLLCKSLLAYQSDFVIEGLLGITVDSSDVFIVGIHETVVADCSGSAEQQQLAAHSTESVVIITSATPDVVIGENVVETTTDDLTQAVIDFGHFLKDGEIMITDLDSDQKHSIPAVVTCDAADKSETNVAEIAIDLVSGYSTAALDQDSRSSALFTNIELEEIIEQCQSSQVVESTCDVFCTEMTDSTKFDDGKLNDVMDDGSVSTVAVETSEDTEPLLLPGDVEEHMTSCLAWDDDLCDIGPLNLAGPQDLSTGLSKKVFMCTSCGQHCKSEKHLLKHDCKVSTDTDDSLLADMPEPLNLISRPLDLTIGVRMDGEDNDSDDAMYGVLMSEEASCSEVTSMQLADDDSSSMACVCGKKFKQADLYARHLTTCAKSKLRPYKSCETCGKVLFSSTGYVKHRRLHEGVYKYRCSVCKQGFFDQTNLRAHADSRHSKVRRYGCSRCNKSFYWKHHVKRHLETCSRDATIVVATSTSDEAPLTNDDSSKDLTL